MTAPELAAMSTRRFLALVAALPAEARFVRAWQRTPRRVDDPSEISRITGLPAS
ncbi:hypothetical protein AB0O04_35905 [Streptomyces althioticus]|uniref:hypothetical protein n=1 Tax=Streptomyces althioticus TaxID=83380 RepID=UPI003421267F